MERRKQKPLIFFAVFLVIVIIFYILLVKWKNPSLLGNDAEEIQESIAVFHQMEKEEIVLLLVENMEEAGENYRCAVYLKKDKESPKREPSEDMPCLAVFQQNGKGDFVKIQSNGDRYWLSRSWEEVSWAVQDIYYVYDVPGPEGRCQFVYVKDERAAVLRDEISEESYDIRERPCLIPFLPYDQNGRFLVEDAQGKRIA